jgi:hypothetical protein
MKRYRLVDGLIFTLAASSVAIASATETDQTVRQPSSAAPSLVLTKQARNNSLPPSPPAVSAVTATKSRELRQCTPIETLKEVAKVVAKVGVCRTNEATCLTDSTTAIGCAFVKGP